MLTENDRVILRHIEKYGFITIEQCKLIYYRHAGEGAGYEMARRRLSMLKREGLIKSGKVSLMNKNVFYDSNKKIPSYHDVLIMDAYSHLAQLGVDKLFFEKNFEWLDRTIISDGMAYFEINKKPYSVIFEICSTHYDIPTEKYDILFESGQAHKICGEFPKIVKVIDIDRKPQKSTLYDIYEIRSDYSQLVKIFLKQ